MPLIPQSLLFVGWGGACVVVDCKGKRSMNHHFAADCSVRASQVTARGNCSSDGGRCDRAYVMSRRCAYLVLLATVAVIEKTGLVDRHGFGWLLRLWVNRGRDELLAVVL